MEYYEDVLGISKNPFPEAGIARSIEDVTVFFWPEGKTAFIFDLEKYLNGPINIIVWNAELGLGKSHTFFYTKKYIEENHKEWLCSYVIYGEISSGLKDIFSFLLSEAFEISLMEELKGQFSDAELLRKALNLNETYLPQVELFWDMINEKSLGSVIGVESEREIGKKFEVLLRILGKKYEKLILLVDQFEDILYDIGQTNVKASRILRDLRSIADNNRDFMHIVLGATEESWYICTDVIYRALGERVIVKSLNNLEKKEDILGFIKEYLSIGEERSDFILKFNDKIIELIREKTQGYPRRLVRSCHSLIENLRENDVRSDFSDTILETLGKESFWVHSLKESRTRKTLAWGEFPLSEILFHIFRNLNRLPTFIFEARDNDRDLRYWISDFRIYNQKEKKWHRSVVYCTDSTWKDFSRESSVKGVPRNSLLFCKNPPRRKTLRAFDLDEIRKWINEKKGNIIMGSLGHFSLDIEDSIDFLREFLPDMYKLTGGH
ncbi:MAG: hypothetical protein AYK18_09560 [Theionarchaea archaeon DG-70]|nr:MAG: hypothetical protein AYK18_09560 [Theionarchaea archaeon DG-70]